MNGWEKEPEKSKMSIPFSHENYYFYARILPKVWISSGISLKEQSKLFVAALIGHHRSQFSVCLWFTHLFMHHLRPCLIWSRLGLSFDEEAAIHLLKHDSFVARWKSSHLSISSRASTHQPALCFGLPPCVEKVKPPQQEPGMYSCWHTHTPSAAEECVLFLGP